MSKSEPTTYGGPSDALADASNVLVLSSAAKDEPCLDLLTQDDDLSTTNALFTTYNKTPDSCVQEWIRHVGRRPADLKIISVGESTRSAASVAAGGPPTAALVETVSHPGDLTGIGIKLSEQLQRWNGDGNEIVFCFHSVSELLQAVDTQTAFRFLHVVTGRFDAVDASAHYHLDPEMFDGQTVSTIKSLFDAAVEQRDGEWIVRSR